jgi:hypothetical protein
MQKKLIYDAEKECPICLGNFKVTRTRVGLSLTGMDPDFRMRYEGVDPIHYLIWVCPHCGYAAQEDCFSSLGDNARAAILKALEGKTVGVNLQGERTLEQALVSYKLALYFGDLRNLPASKIGGLYLKMAWLYRDKQEADLEQVCLAKAAECYTRAYSNERFPIGKMTENTLVYLIANLLDCIGETKQAVTWLGKIIGSKEKSGEAKIYSMAQDLWYRIKEKRAAVGLTDQE